MSTTVKVDWDVKAIEADVKEAAIRALQDGAELILDESNKIAPVDEGTLIRSGNTSIDEDNLSANVFYDTPYAVRQHEDMTMRHKNGRRAKFLESAANENADMVARYIRDQIAKVLS